ncbi:MAG: hypothetical protein PHT19_08865 [Methylococcus sp.]|nr:hypothetical protein [Methylococcus sp.]
MAKRSTVGAGRDRLDVSVTTAIPNTLLELGGREDAEGLGLRVEFRHYDGTPFADCELDVQKASKKKAVFAAAERYRKGVLQGLIGICDTNLATPVADLAVPDIQPWDAAVLRNAAGADLMVGTFTPITGSPPPVPTPTPSPMPTPTPTPEPTPTPTPFPTTVSISMGLDLGGHSICVPGVVYIGPPCVPLNYCENGMQPALLYAIISAGSAPKGTVTFREGERAFAPVAVSPAPSGTPANMGFAAGGKVYLSPGWHTIKAEYSGDDRNLPAIAVTDHLVTCAP